MVLINNTYQIIKVLHEGVNNQVLLAEKLPEKTPVILKSLRPESISESTVQKLKNEWSLLNSLNLPSTIKTVEFIENENEAVLVLEYHESQNLAKYIENQPWNLSERLQIAISIAEALGEIHQKNIIHKDIKPQNILIDEKRQIKLIDFSNSTSIAREAPQEIAVNKLEGTLAYISPEQTARMARMVDYRTDIYSLGVTFYHMFTGEVPFTADTPLELIHLHITQLPMPPCEVNNTIPQALSDIILKCMSKNTEDRYKSAYGLVLDLKKCYEELKNEGKVSPFTPGSVIFSIAFILLKKSTVEKKSLEQYRSV